eukprot:6249442-Amphidinium_carterae.1
MGGGVFCAEHMAERAATFGGPQLCQGNGEVALAFGAPEYIGLSWSSDFAPNNLKIKRPPSAPPNHTFV